jgi:hypothetical protein
MQSAPLTQTAAETTIPAERSDILLLARTGCHRLEVVAYFAGPMTSPSRYMSVLALRPLRQSVLLVLLLLCAIFSETSRGKAAPGPRSASSQVLMGSRFAIADFDGDSRPDLATVEFGQVGTSRAQYWIGFQMSAGPQQLIGVTAPVGGLEIALRDVNGDKNLDLIVTTRSLDRPVVILVNDGHGNFTLTDPTALSDVVLNVGEARALPNSETKDAAAAVLGRGCGDCAVDDRGGETRVTPEARAAEVFCDHAFPLGVSVLGRAPPAGDHHV